MSLLIANIITARDQRTQTGCYQNRNRSINPGPKKFSGQFGPIGPTDRGSLIKAGFDLLNIGIRTALIHAPFYKFTLIGTLVMMIASFLSQMNLNFILWVQGLKVSITLQFNIAMKTFIRHRKLINSCWK